MLKQYARNPGVPWCPHGKMFQFSVIRYFCVTKYNSPCSLFGSVVPEMFRTV